MSRRPSRPGDPPVSPREAKPDSGPRWSRIIKITAVAVVLALGVAVAVPLVVTATPEFFSRFHLLERRYVNLEGSAHEGIGCRMCHQTRPIANGAELVAEFYMSYVTTDTTPRYFDFGPPRREACLQCHAGDWSTETDRTDKIPHPAHLRVASETRNCVDCHKWTAHMEPYIEKHKTMPFSGVCVAYGCHVGTKTTEQCFDCHHVLHESGEQWQTAHKSIVRSAGQNSCVESCHGIDQCQQCHTTGKRPEFEGLPIEITMKAIEELHVRPDWTQRYHGAEALKNTDDCLRCHVTESECDECHLQRPAFHGSTDTWIGRHSKQSDTVDDPGCLACHDKAWCEDCHRQFKEME